MKKLSVFAAVLGATAIFATGCASDKDASYLKDINPDNYVTLGDYKGVSVDVASQEVTDEAVKEEIDRVLSHYGGYEEVKGRTKAQNGDIANIDYAGKVDGVAFDGGTREGYDLTLGSGKFIPGFEDQVVGMEVGETKDITVTFPDPYEANEDLSGKEAVFTVTLHSLKDSSKPVTPELTDEFVASTGYGGATTVKELEDYVRNDLQTDAQSAYENELYVKLQETVQNNTTFKKDAPEPFINRLTDSMLASINDTASMYGMDAGTIALYQYGFNPETYEEEVKNYCKDTYSKQLLMVSAIAKKEGIEVTDADIETSIRETLDSYGSDMSVDEYKELIGDVEQYREYLLVEKVMDLLVENADIHEN